MNDQMPKRFRYCINQETADILGVEEGHPDFIITKPLEESAAWKDSPKPTPHWIFYDEKATEE